MEYSLKPLKQPEKSEIAATRVPSQPVAENTTSYKLTCSRGGPRPPKFLALSACVPQANSHSFADEIALKLRRLSGRREPRS